jgi:hypothetical protein
MNSMLSAIIDRKTLSGYYDSKSSIESYLLERVENGKKREARNNRLRKENHRKRWCKKKTARTRKNNDRILILTNYVPLVDKRYSS